ncbi:cytosolic protein [Candidatus Micrarchaeota archaeon CG08_land_8_20_14_0_20_59_11]|nr:MAG: cytosolic protein [Candidatus Micrarchaeota archaeon CG08_land_8_20_14_0_20_59_11]
MKPIKLIEVKNFVEEHITEFHDARLQSLEKTSLKELLKRKNPYLYRAKNLVTAGELVSSILDAKLSSSEEELFGEFLEHLAIFVAQKTRNAAKSSAPGIDFEYQDGRTRYLVSVKSGLNWGNSSQWNALEDSFKTAMKRIKQNRGVSDVQCILGVSYGNQKTMVKKGFIVQICGQNFWYMVSGSKDFYIQIVEPLGHRAKELNDSFKQRKARLVNKFTGEFISDFCDRDGTILWNKVIEFNSGNLRL